MDAANVKLYERPMDISTLSGITVTQYPTGPIVKNFRDKISDLASVE
jgi:hypothetical protein